MLIPQVGQALRVVVVDVTREGDPPAPLRIANPEILWHSEEKLTVNEGCLSLPDEVTEGDLRRVGEHQSSDFVW